MPLVLTRSDVSRERETRSQNYTRMYSFDDATTQKMRRIFAKGRFQKNFRKLLQRGGIDARSVQKTPAGTVKNVRPVHFLPTCLLRNHAAA